MSDELVRPARLEDLKYIIDLSKKNSFSIGFIPKQAYEAAITGLKPSKNRWSDRCNDKLYVCEINGDLVGFVLASFGNPLSKIRIGKIAQICLQEDARMMQRGRMLLTEVLEYGKSNVQTLSFSCGCAYDLESNLFWKAMGWKKIGERKGKHFSNTWKECSDRLINIYRYDSKIIESSLLFG